MKHSLRALALALALAATPACASLNLGAANPIAAEQTLEQRAYALISAYAAILEEAADIVRDPAVPLHVKRALGAAERAATPAVEALQLAVAASGAGSADTSQLAGAIADAEGRIAVMRSLLKRQD